MCLAVVIRTILLRAIVGRPRGVLTFLLLGLRLSLLLSLLLLLVLLLRLLLLLPLLLFQWPLLRTRLLPGAELVGFALVDLRTLFRSRSLSHQRVLRPGSVLTSRRGRFLSSFRRIRTRRILWFRTLRFGPLGFRTIGLRLPFRLVLFRLTSGIIRAWNVRRRIGARRIRRFVGTRWFIRTSGLIAASWFIRLRRLIRTRGLVGPSGFIGTCRCVRTSRFISARVIGGFRRSARCAGARRFCGSIRPHRFGA